MDSQGFVFLSVLAKFNRIKQLTQETELIRYVCLNSPNIEFRMGPDGLDRLRKREGWQQWILNMEERDPSAQNDGPPQDYQTRAHSGQVFEIPSNLGEGQASAPQFSLANHRVEDVAYPLADDVPPPVPTTNGTIMNGPLAQTPLSAAVPDFAPAAPALSGHSHPQLETQPTGTSSFTDEQVESLMIVVRKPVNASASTPPFHSTARRTFSNGSLDSRTIHDDLVKAEERRSSSSVNGDNGSEM
jgi:la-related protein 1